MKYGLKQDQLKKISDTLKSNKKIKRALIFGSRAKGINKEGSDIDICVEAEGLSLSELNSIRINLDELMLPYKIDLIDINSVSNSDIREHIMRVGKEI